MNYTDVDDKTIAGSVKAGKPLREYTEEWVNAFRSDVDSSASRRPNTRRARPTMSTCRRCATWSLALERNGHTYRRDGSIYFKIETLPTYGRLARLDQQRPPRRRERRPRRILEGRCTRLRVVEGSRNPESRRGNAPGCRVALAGTSSARRWRCGCSTDAPIDIHAGGVDLIFPHHENEIAQAEGATKQTFSRFWVHVEHLFVENEKMSKSLGNVYTVPDIVAKGFRPSALRYLLLSSHYRKQLNFTWSGMEQAEESLRRVVDFLVRLDGVTGEGNFGRRRSRCVKAREAFKAALESDLNTAAGLAALFDLVKSGNAAIDAGKMSAADARLVRSTIDDLDRVLGVVVASAGRGREAADAGRGDRAHDRGAKGREAAPGFRRGRSDSHVAGRSRRAARGWSVRHQMEEEVR